MNKNRKVPDCIKRVTNIEGKVIAVVETKKIWDFEVLGDIDSKLVLIELPTSECLVCEYKQDIPNNELRKADLRGYSPAVGRAKSINYNKGLGWLTNSEIELKRNIKYNTLDSFMSKPETVIEKFFKFFKISPKLFTEVSE